MNWANWTEQDSREDLDLQNQSQSLPSNAYSTTTYESYDIFLSQMESRQRLTAEAVEKGLEELHSETDIASPWSEKCCDIAQLLESRLTGAAAAATQAATATAQVMDIVRILRELLKAGTEREAQLHATLEQERVSHKNAIKLLEQEREENHEHIEELQQELNQISGELEQKADQVLSIQFEMATLQSRLNDDVEALEETHMQLDKAELGVQAVHDGQKQLAKEDLQVDCIDEDTLQIELKHKDEMMLQMNEACVGLHGKVARLSHELEASRAAYQALDKQSSAIIKHLEFDLECLRNDMEDEQIGLHSNKSGFRRQVSI